MSRFQHSLECIIRA